MKKYAYILTAILLVLLLSLSFYAGRKSVKREIIHDTDTVTVTKTVSVPVPVPQIIEKVRTDTLLVMVPQPEPEDTTQTQSGKPEKNDSVAVEIPIERKTYETGLYKAVVEGFRPSLVSLDIYQQTQVVTRRKRWNFTLGIQTGYGITPAGWQPYAGLGVTFGYSF